MENCQPVKRFKNNNKKTVSSVIHHPEDGRFRSKRGISHNYEAVVFDCGVVIAINTVKYFAARDVYIFIFSKFCLLLQPVCCSCFLSRNPKHCNVSLEVKHVLRQNVCVCIKIHEHD
jgi:hypothetical protein